MFVRSPARYFHALKSVSGKDVVCWGSVALVLLVIAVAIHLSLPTVRVGDGMEYYGLFYAWTETARPWMTDASFAWYQRLHEAGSVIGTLDRSYLENAFPALKLRDTSDFNHFWFYSLLAAIVQAPLESVGFQIGPHASFLLLHGVLFISLLIVASVCNGRHGFWAVLVLTLGSPIIWYFNKVHTEFLTYCVTLAGVALAMRNQLLIGALFMAIAATQNPGLSFVPVSMVALRVLGDWKRAYSRWEVAAAVMTVLLLALHPAYYFLRYEVVTPQLLAGGAAPGAGLSIAYIWLLDPDVGLFPNWPFGLLLIVWGAACWRSSAAVDERSRPVKNSGFWLIFAIFFAASMYSHASTENLNSGATPGLARYALWYIPLAYPAVLAVITACSDAAMRRRLLATAIIVTGVVATAYAYLSVRWESYTRPSIVSRIVQTHAPWLYTPPPEIFGERYSGVGEPMSAVSAVVGPDCKKTLLLPPQAGEGKISVSARCGFEGEQIRVWVTAERRTISTPTYVTLQPGDVKDPPQISVDKIYRHDVDASVGVRFSGWSAAEAKHRWSDAIESDITFVLPDTQPASERCLSIDGFTYGRQTIIASVNDEMVFSRAYDGDAALVIPLAERSGTIHLRLRYSNPRKPPTDERLVAFGIRSLRVSACP